jgi:hypothetical protein
MYQAAEGNRVPLKAQILSKERYLFFNMAFLCFIKLKFAKNACYGKRLFQIKLAHS